MNLFITAEQAIEFLNEGDEIRTFRNGPGMIMGCDIGREAIINKLRAAPSIEIAGPGARALGHPIAIIDDNGPLFIEADMDKVNEFDKDHVKGNE